MNDHNIVYSRKRIFIHADGREVITLVEERHQWPLQTCRNFARAFPSSVISITPVPLEDRRGRRYTRDQVAAAGRRVRGENVGDVDHGSYTVSEPKRRPEVFDYGSMINEETGS